MWEKLRVVFTIPELRMKIFLTLGLLAVYRIGYFVPLPVVDQKALNVQTPSEGLGDLIAKVSIFSASDLSQATIFGLGIMPYISASIILQLLGSVWKPLEELRKEGEAGRKKINEYTRYLTVVLCLIQSYMYVRIWLMSTQGGPAPVLIDDAFLSASSGNLHFGWQLVTVLTMTCGSVFLMWLGEQIDEFGIGNGISLLIMAGILARMPAALIKLLSPSNMKYRLTGFFGGEIGIETLVVLVFIFVGVVVGVVFITQGQRRIPTQSAKHVRGRRVYGGTRQYLPLRINQAGVMPIIFASSLLMLPHMLFSMLAKLCGGAGRFFAQASTTSCMWR
jgi:preprotein translocase subunit SecY